MSAERKYLLSAVTAFLRPTRAGARRYRQVTQNARESGWRGLTSRCLSGTLRTRTQNIGGWLQKAAPDRRVGAPAASSTLTISARDAHRALPERRHSQPQDRHIARTLTPVTECGEIGAYLLRARGAASSG